MIDIPVGKTAKVRSHADTQKLEFYFRRMGLDIGLEIKVLITDG